MTIKEVLRTLKNKSGRSRREEHILAYETRTCQLKQTVSFQ